MDSLDPLFETYKAKSERLRAFDAGIDAKLESVLGLDWEIDPEHRVTEVLTQRQRDWRALRDYFEMAIVCNGDLFGYLGMIYGNLDAFRAIGAIKTLDAAEALRSLYDRQQSLGSQEEKDAFWRETEEERLRIECKAETMLEFADLLIKFAEAHPGEFVAVVPGDPLENISGGLKALAEHLIKKRSAS